MFVHLDAIAGAQPAAEIGEAVSDRIEKAAAGREARAVARPDRSYRPRRTGARTPRAGCAPSAAASCGFATRWCRCTRSSTRCRRRRRTVTRATARATPAASRARSGSRRAGRSRRRLRRPSRSRPGRLRRQKPRARRAVDRVVGRPVPQPADDDEAIAKGCERLQDWRELERAAVGRRRPFRHDDAVRHVDDAQTMDRARRPSRACEGRHHAVEEGERDGGRRGHEAPFAVTATFS